jgi:cytochrome c biogenesis protein CcmG, thiol:disulfide interchange protein DsbE
LSQPVSIQPRPLKSVLFFLFFVIGISIATYWAIDRFITNKDVTLDQLDAAKKSLTFSFAPDFTLQDILGTQLTLSQLKNKIIVVHFWASWCPPCVEEFPSLLKFADKFKNDVIVLAVSEDTANEEMLTFLKRIHYAPIDSLHILVDLNGHVAKSYGSYKLPESYILQSDLKVVRKISGSRDWLSYSAQEDLNKAKSN